MKKALILDNKVIDITDTEFEVANTMSWMDCSDDCTTFWTLVDGDLTAPEPYPEETYAQKRQVEYPSIDDLVVALYDTDDKSAVEAKRAAVKLKYPKP